MDVFTKKYLYNAVKHAESTLSGNYKSGNSFAKKIEKMNSIILELEDQVTADNIINCKCQRKSEPGAHEKVSHKRPRKSEPERSRIVEPVC